MLLELLHFGEHSRVCHYFGVGQFFGGYDLEQMRLEQLQDASEELVVAGLILASGKSTIYRHSVIAE